MKKRSTKLPECARPLPRITRFTPWRGVFETLRVIEGQPEFVQEHWESLLRACRALRLPAPLDFRQRLSLLPKKTGRWRWVVTDDTSEDSFQEQPLDTKRFYTLSLSPVRVGSRNWDTQYKTLSYLTHAQARESVRTDEALILNENGHVVSGAMSNLFWTHRGKFYTPSSESGCRLGIIRHVWMQSLRKLKIPIQEVLVKPLTLQKADSIYLTNSWIGIKPAKLKVHTS